MKKIVCLAAFILASGCGALNHSKDSSAPTAAKNGGHTPSTQAISLPTTPITLQNLDSGPHEWTQNSDDISMKLMILGTFSRESLNALAARTSMPVKAVGTLRVTESYLQYPAHFEGDQPKATQKETKKNFPKTDVYLIQTDTSSPSVSLAIAESKFQAMQEPNPTQTVEYNDQTVCTIYQPIYTMNLPGIDPGPFHCDGFHCWLESKLEGFAQFNKPYAEVQKGFPKGNCLAHDRLPTERANFETKTTVTGYEVELKDEFLNVAPTLKFEASRSN